MMYYHRCLSFIPILYAYLPGSHKNFQDKEGCEWKMSKKHRSSGHGWLCFFLRIVLLWSMRVEGAEAGSRVPMAVGMTDTALREVREVTSMN